MIQTLHDILSAGWGGMLLRGAAMTVFISLCGIGLGMVIGIAGSTDLEHWSDRGLVPLTLPNVSFSDVAESPLILRRDATPLLFMWTTKITIWFPG